MTLVRNQDRSPNSQAEVNKRVGLGQATCLKALVVVSGRSVLAIAAQAVVAGIFVLKHNPSPWSAAAPWCRCTQR